MFYGLHIKTCKKKVTCLTFRDFYDLSEVACLKFCSFDACKKHLSRNWFIYAFYAHKEHLKKVACLTLCAFNANKKHLSESRLFIPFMLIKNIYVKSRLFILFMLIKNI